MSKTNSSPNDVVQLCAWEFVQIRALCEEIMDNLCQAKALLAPINETDFFYSMEMETLQHYFYALDTIINCALQAKDEICHLIDYWEKKANDPKELIDSVKKEK